MEAANSSLQSEVVERRLTENQNQELLRQLVTAQENERRRISRELHDQLGQQLAVLTLGLERLREESGGDAGIGDTRETIRHLQRAAAALDRDIDRIAVELRPTALDDLGLRAALEQCAADWSAAHNTPLDFYDTGLDGERAAPEIETTLYRIAQEALTNIAKHARADRASLIVERRADGLLLIVEDDGRGFDPDAIAPRERNDGDDNGGGLGLVGMRERVALVVGSLAIESAPGKGTTVFVRVPLAR